MFPLTNFTRVASDRITARALSVSHHGANNLASSGRRIADGIAMHVATPAAAALAALDSKKLIC
jgi:hypothetical protein